jgi:hypothetical protein
MFVTISAVIFFGFTEGGKNLLANVKITPLNSVKACEIAPSLTFVGRDALQPSLSLGTPTNVYYMVNDKYVGTSYTAVKGDNIKFIADNTSYIAREFTYGPVDCGAQNVPVDLYATANNSVSVKVYNDAGTDVLTNAASGATTTNETAFSSGGSKTWRIHIEGSNLQSTGNQMLYVELPTNSAVNVSTVTLNGANPLASTSTYISATNTNPYKVAFEIPSLENGATADYYLKVKLTNGKILTTGAVYFKLFEEQPFVDTDGKFKTGIYDSVGTSKFEAYHNYEFVVGSNG